MKNRTFAASTETDLAYVAEIQGGSLTAERLAMFLDFVKIGFAGFRVGIAIAQHPLTTPEQLKQLAQARSAKVAKAAEAAIAARG